MAETRQELSFELERFEWAADDRLEVVGRWHGLTGRRLGRPVLHVEADGRRRRVTATPGGQLRAGEEWRASFAWPHGPADVESAELEIGRSLLVELPAPRRKRKPKPEPDSALHDEIAALRARVAELESAPREEDTGLREQFEALQDQHAALIAGSGELRGELAEALAAQERLTEELEALREAHAAEQAEREKLAGELEAVRGEADQRLAAERDAAELRMSEQRAENTEMREKIASAREEAQKAMAAEAQETEQLRTELRDARDESEKALAAERAETARLREELAARPPTDDGDEGSDEAGRRMYERISRELDRERATVRNLRRELEATQAMTAEHRREAAAAATNGVHTTSEETPVAATAAGRRRAASAMAQRAGADPRAPYRRVEAARAAAAHRVPEHEQSTAGVWAMRAAAVALVAVLLIALVIIISALA